MTMAVARSAFVIASCTLFLIPGCAKGRSEVTVSVSSSALISDVDQLVVQISDRAKSRTAQPVYVRLPDRPATLPPARTIPLGLPADIDGAIEVRVAAINVAGAQLAIGTGELTVRPSHSYRLSVSLGPPPSVANSTFTVDRSTNVVADGADHANA